MNRNRAAGDYHDGRKVEGVKRNPGDEAAALHHVQGKTEDVSAIAELAFEFEMHPAKHERKRSQSGNDAACENGKDHGCCFVWIAGFCGR